jgi:hypothetical protein
MLDQLINEPNLRFIMIGFAVLITVMGFMRGIGRLIVLAVALAAGAGAALAWWRYMPGVKMSWWERTPEEFIKWGALGVGLVTAFIVRRLLGAIFSGGGSGEMDGRTRVRGGLLGFIPSLVLVWGGAVGLRWAGAASHLRHVEQAVKAQDVNLLSDADLMARISQSMDKGTLGDILNRTDFMESRESKAMATLLTLQWNDDVWKRTWRHPQAGPVVQQPSFQRLQEDRDVRQALSYSHYSRLLALPEMNIALKNTVLREAVLNLDMDTVLREVITGHTAAANGIPRAEVVP